MKNIGYTDYSPKNNSTRAQQNAYVRAHKQLSSAGKPALTSTNRNTRHVSFHSKANETDTVDIGTALAFFRDGLNAGGNGSSDPADEYVKRCMSRSNGTATFQQKGTKRKG